MIFNAERKTWCLLSCILQFIVYEASCEKPVERLGRYIGYFNQNSLPLIRLEFTSDGMALKKCLNICGLRGVYYASVADNVCTCSSSAVGPINTNACPQSISCAGNPAQMCGCQDGSFALYNTSADGLMKISLKTGTHQYASFSGTVTFQLFGDAGECNEGVLNNVSLINGGTLIVLYKCRTMGVIKFIRVGNIKPTLDAWQLQTISIRVEHDNQTVTIYQFNYNGWIGNETVSGKSYGIMFPVVDIFANPAAAAQPYTYPDQVTEEDNVYRSFTAVFNPFMICSMNSDCHHWENGTYVAFEGFFYKRIFYFSHIYYTLRGGCDGPQKPPANVTIIPPLDPWPTYVEYMTTVQYECIRGVFEDSATKSITVTCNSTGLWSTSNLLCVTVCLVDPVAVADNMIRTEADKGNEFGSKLSYQCTFGVFRGTRLSRLDNVCQDNGQWSLTTISPCVQEPVIWPHQMHTSRIEL